MTLGSKTITICNLLINKMLVLILMLSKLQFNQRLLSFMREKSMPLTAMPRWQLLKPNDALKRKRGVPKRHPDKSGKKRYQHLGP